MYFPWKEIEKERKSVLYILSATIALLLSATVTQNATLAADEMSQLSQGQNGQAQSMYLAIGPCDNATVATIPSTASRISSFPPAALAAFWLYCVGATAIR